MKVNNEDIRQSQSLPHVERLLENKSAAVEEGRFTVVKSASERVSALADTGALVGENQAGECT
jgi:hypothetical protein